MIHNHPILYLLVLMLAVPILLSCTTAPPPDTSAADGEAIKSVSKQWVDAFNRRDAAAVAAIYTEDAKRFPPNSPMIVGRENIQVWIQVSLDVGIGNLQATMIELSINGDMAYEVGEYTLTIEPEEGEATSDSGNYVEIWKRVNGSWKISTDIFNSSVPLPAPEEEE